MEALHAFLHISTQFRFACPGDGRMLRTGLDYTAALNGLGADGITVTPELWFDIKMIEAGAIEAGQAEAPSWP